MSDERISIRGPYHKTDPEHSPRCGEYVGCVCDELDIAEDLNTGEKFILNKVEEYASGGKKEIEGKLRMDLIPPESILSYSQVLTFGASKYADRNWEKGIPISQCLGALKRHLTSFELGVMINNESGLFHIQHAAFWANALVTYLLRKRDDLNDLPPYNKE